MSQTFSCVIQLSFCLLENKNFWLFYLNQRRKSGFNLHADVPDPPLRAGSAVPGCQRWFWGSHAPAGFPSAPPALLAAAGEAERHQYMWLFICSSRVCFLWGEKRASLETDLHARLLRSAGGDLGGVMGLLGLPWETHDRSCDGGRWGVVTGNLHTHKEH